MTDPRSDVAKRGTLRIYLGAAPGVGKTFSMLNEGRRRNGRGTDVVIGFVETHGRAKTAEQIADLEVVPRKALEYRGTRFEEMDVDAILARRPQVALVDELAHTNVPGSRNAKRCEDVGELLEAGIDVVTTVNIQHLESINDVVERITGIKQAETIPDEVVRAADQVELVDMTPEALRRRMAHGNIYAAEKIDTALANYFRVGNLAALRELALLWVADQVDVALEEYRARHGILEPWETRERVVVALTGAPGTESLIRRGARIAQRAHGELLGVHVQSEEGLAAPASGVVQDHRKLLLDMGGEYHEVSGSDVGAALVDFALAENATQIVLGSSRRTRWQEMIRGSVINRVVRASGPIDVHVVSHDQEGDSDEGRRPSRGAPTIPIRRQVLGWVLIGVGIPVLAIVLATFRESLELSTVLLLFLGLVVITAAVGGRAPAFVGAVISFLVANWFFTPPLYELTVSEAENAVALFVFLGVAAVVSNFVMSAARRATEALRARAEAETLAGLAIALGDDDPLTTVIGRLVSTFGLGSAAVLRRESNAWTVEAAAGASPPALPEDADVVEELSGDAVLALVGPGLRAEDRAVLKAFTAQLTAVMERRSLRVEAHRAQLLTDANELRAALLQAVSHDLRTPLAAIKASASSLSNEEMEWAPEDEREFVHTIEEETDRLTTLVENLLDMSRLQAGVLQARLRPVQVDEIVASALAGLGPRAARVDAEAAHAVEPVLADSPLLERAVANVVENALRWSPEDRSVRVEAGSFGGSVDLRVVDQGPGISPEDRDGVFQPFQRLHDARDTGVGLGLAVARGFVLAMGGTVEIDDTPGGGTTVIITMPAASGAVAPPPDVRASGGR